jgi:calcium-dependent protein kinase
MVEEIMENADMNGSGQIDYTEYLVSAIQRERIITKDLITKAFNSFDLDGDGLITKEEWEKVFGGITMSSQEWNMFLEEIDSNKDGMVSREEFFNFLEKHYHKPTSLKSLKHF